MSSLDIKTNKPKYMSQVNLDALIPREDLEIKEAKYNNINQINNIYVPNLKRGELFVDNLRKPQFQRSTLEWTPQKVYGLIKSFADGDLIPAVILWRGDGYNFVIDGAHRLSALIAWVNNDYGDGNYSTSFFGSMEKGQRDKARQTKKLVEQNIGSYADIIFASQNPVLADPRRVEIAQRISSLSIILQWVPGNASQAEASFFRINESASPLNGTEKRLLKGRNKPTAIAARAIIRAGAGHKYWGKFSQKNQERIEEIATNIHEWLFDPKLETPIKTVDVPLAGKSYVDSTQELILNAVNFSNNLKIVDASKTNSDNFPELLIPDETTDGEETIRFLSNAKKMLANLTGNQSCSLGLHPAIYFYSKQGRYQVTSFLAMLNLVKKYEQEDKLIKFTTVRSKFEDFFWKHKAIVNQAQSQWGSGAKGYVKLYELIDFIIAELLQGGNEDSILFSLDSHEDYKFYKAGVRELNPKFVTDFSTDSKTEVFFNEAMKSALKCKICDGYLHRNSMNIDHIEDKKLGGKGNSDNGQLTHYYCNGAKDALIKAGFYKP